MTVDYQKLNEVVILIEAAVPDVVSLLEKISTSSTIWYAAIDLANEFSLVPVHKEPQSLLSVRKSVSIPLQFYLQDRFTLLPYVTT